MVPPVSENRCVSGLHIHNGLRICKACQSTRRAIWNASDPVAAKAKYESINAVALEEARLFCLAREKAEKLAFEVEAAKYWEEYAHKGVAYRIKNVSACRAMSNNTRARRISAKGRLSYDLLDRLYKLQRGKCPCCKKALGKDFHMDHIEPLSKGGENVDSNIQLLRSRCNLLKSAMVPLLFMQANGFLL